MKPSRDNVHNQIIATLKGIKNGKSLRESVTFPPMGSRIRIIDALSNARDNLEEIFHADHIELVDAAFWALGGNRPSDRINECAASLLDILKNRIELRGPSEAAFETRFSINSRRYVRVKDNKAFIYWGRYTSEFPCTWEAYVWFKEDKPHDVFKNARFELKGQDLPNIRMSPDLLRDLTCQVIEQSIEDCETV